MGWSCVHTLGIKRILSEMCVRIRWSAPPGSAGALSIANRRKCQKLKTELKGGSRVYMFPRISLAFWDLWGADEVVSEADTQMCSDTVQWLKYEGGGRREGRTHARTRSTEEWTGCYFPALMPMWKWKFINPRQGNDSLKPAVVNRSGRAFARSPIYSRDLAAFSILNHRRAPFHTDPSL